MSMDIDIKVDAPGALPTIAGVESALDKVEAAGPRVGAAISAGLREGSTAADKAKASTQDLAEQMNKLANVGGAFAGLTAQLEREADMLEAIRGPAREYQSDLEALDGLLMKNTISTQEYADAVTKLNAKMGDRPTAAASAGSEGREKTEGGIEGIGGALSAQGGELGAVIGQIASGSAVEAAALAGVAIEAVHLGDEYIELRNNALRLAESYDTVDQTITQQLDLAGELHGSLEQTMELSTIVKERTEDLGLSMSAQTQFTKDLGEAVELSGHSLADASGVINNLSFALESGLPAGRQMKTLMQEYPALGEAMTSSLGMTSKQIVDMAQKGQLSMGEWVGSIRTAGDSIEANFSKRTETAGEAWGHFKDQLTVTGGKLVESTGLIKVLGAGIGVLSDVTKLVTGGLGILHDELGDVGTAAAAMGAAVAVGLGPLGAAIGALELARAAGEGLANWLYADEIAQSKLDKAMADANITYSKQMESVIADADAIERDIQSHNDLFDSVTRVAQAMASGTKIIDDQNTKFSGLIDKVDAYRAAVNQIQSFQADLKGRGMADPTKALNAGDVATIRGYQDAQQQLLDQGTRYGDVLSKIHEKEVERARGIEDLTGALKAHLITQQEYNTALKEYETHQPKAPGAKPLGIGSSLERGFVNKHGGDYGAGYGEGVDLGDTPDLADVTVPKADPRAEEALKLYESLLTPVQKYEAELEKLKGLQDVMSSGTYATALADLEKKYTAFHSPQEQMALDLKKITDAQATGLDSTTALDDAMRKWRMQYDQGTFGDGIIDGFEKIKKAVGDVASTVSTTMTSAFNAVNAAISTLVTTGTVDLSALGKQFEKLAVDASLKSIESSIFNPAKDVANATQTATTTAAMATGGATAGTEIATAMTAAGADVAVQIAAAMTGTSAAGGGASSLLGSIFGSSDAAAGSGAAADAASGVSMDDLALAIPGAATGFSARIGGSGGTDSKLAMMRVTPGEYLHVQTPQQHADSQGGGSQRPVVVQGGINHDDIKRSLLQVLSSGDADVHQMNMLRRNTGAVQAMIKK